MWTICTAHSLPTSLRSISTKVVCSSSGNNNNNIIVVIVTAEKNLYSQNAKKTIDAVIEMKEERTEGNIEMKEEKNKRAIGK